MERQTSRFGCVRLLAGLMAVGFALIQASAAITALRAPNPTLLTAGIGGLAGLWAGLFGWAGLLFIGRRRTAGVFCAWIVLAFIVVNGVRQIVFTRADYESGRFPFLLATSIVIGIIPLTYLVYHYWRRGQQYGENSL